MAALVSTALTEMRAILRDKSGSPGFTDAQGITFLNMAFLWWRENMERRTERTALTLVTGGIGGATKWAQGRAVDDIEFSADVAEILEMGLDGSDPSGGSPGEVIPLDRASWGDLRSRHAATPTEAQPTHWAAVKLNGSYRWKLMLYPPANLAATGPDVEWDLIAVVRLQPTALSLTTHRIDVGDSETGSVVTIASMLAAPRTGRPNLAKHLRSLLPRVVRDKMETTQVHDEANA